MLFLPGHPLEEIAGYMNRPRFGRMKGLNVNRETHDEDVIQRLVDLAGNACAGDDDVETLIADARDPSSPLHPELTWDDTQAAVQCRQVQAYLLIEAGQLALSGALGLGETGVPT